MAEEKPATAAAGEAKKRKVPKGRHLSAIKRHRQSLKRADRNQTALSAVKTAIKKVKQAVVAKDAARIQTSLRTAMSLLHRAASKGILHHRNAARHIARLSTLAHRMNSVANPSTS